MTAEPDNENIWHDKLLDAVVAVITALEIGRGTETRVVKAKTFETAGVVGPIRPCVVVSIDDSRETALPFDTENDERVLSVLVSYLDRQDRKQAGLAEYLAIRQKLTNAFLMQLFSSVVTCWDVDVVHYDVLEVERLKGPAMADHLGSLELRAHVITERVRPVA